MPSLRQEIAELRRRMIALESRQLAWRHDAAAKGSPQTGASRQDVPFELTDGMRRALDILWAHSVKRGQPFTQVATTLCDDETVIVEAYFRDGSDVMAHFEKPADFDAYACRQAFEGHLNVEL